MIHEDILLIKSGDENHMQEFYEEGLIYMKTLKYYANITDSERRDELEDVHLLIPENSQKKYALQIKEGDVFKNTAIVNSVRSNLKGYAYCMHFINPVEEERNGKSFKIDLKGEYIVIITDYSEFKKRVEKELFVEGIASTFDKVVYKTFSPDYIFKTRFEKPEKYWNEREFRIVLDYENQETYTFNIKDGIKDIATIQKANKSSEFKCSNSNLLLKKI